jgi:uncharacterized protein YecE (DUF72 family)
LRFVGDFFVGTSGFASPVMRGAVPAPTASAPDLLAAYSRLFPAVELDSVFYRRPSEETVGTWIDATPEDFRFSIRVPREITHVDLLQAPDRARDFIRTIEALGSRLGTVLFTTPPTFGCEVARFESILDAIPTGVRTAWEFRHPSWMCPDVLEQLAGRDCCPVIVEGFEEAYARDLLPGGPLADRYEFPFVYVRFRRESYTYADLVVWGDVLADVIGEGRDVYAFFRPAPEATCYATALSELLAEAKAATFESADGVPSAPPAAPAGPPVTPSPMQQAIL